MVLPNFLIIGAAKAGTTSIANYLNQHPQIYISPIKEPFFFSFEGQELEFLGPGDDESLKLAVTTFEQYERLFDGVQSEIAIGEASTSYLYTPRAASKIHEYLPTAKIIAILRNPIYKAYSSFLHQAREGFESAESFSDALEKEEERVRRNWMFFWHYRRNGFYYEKLKRYYDLFPNEQLYIGLYDDFKQDPLNFLQHLFDFLSVDTSFEPDVAIQYNVSGIPRSRILHHVTTKSSMVKKVLRPLVPRAARQKLRQFNLEKPDLPESLRYRLADEYREDIYKLEQLISKDLSRWHM